MRLLLVQRKIKFTANKSLSRAFLGFFLLIALHTGKVFCYQGFLSTGRMNPYMKPFVRQGSQRYCRRVAPLFGLSSRALVNYVHPQGKNNIVHPVSKAIRINDITRQHSSALPAMTSKPGEGVPIDSDHSAEGHSDYEKWVRRLYQTNLFNAVKLGLDNIDKLHELLGRPMDKTVVVHIAGTNGKGSVALKIAKTLELSSSDLRVGLFCSPHVSSFRERMQMNGELISEEEVAEFLPYIYQLCQDHGIPATFFEITAALAFKFFAERKADVVVLETGLGGRLDATNVVKAPALCIITSIGLEHTRILGDTIEKIALEKGGIIKEGRPVLVGPNVPHEVLRQCAAEKQAGKYYLCEDVLGPLSKEITDYDEENSRTASAALTLLQKSHPDTVGRISSDVMARGTSERPPCRFEMLEVDGVRVVLDVAHNPSAMDHLVRKLKENYPKNRIRMIVGMSRDKDLKQCAGSVLEATSDDATSIHLVEASHPRAAELEAMVEAEPRLKGACHCDLEDRSVTAQIRSAMTMAKDRGEVLVVCGSVFLMAEAREALGFEEPRDSEYIAEVAGSHLKHGQENFGDTLVAATPR